MKEIEKFIDRVQKSTKAHSRELRLTMVEAQSLSNELALLLAKEHKLLEKINQLQEQNPTTKDSVNLGDVTMDGGSFKS